MDHDLPPESEDDNIEYKRHLIDIKFKKMQELSAQMKCRLDIGNGVCYYEIGVEDDGVIVGMTDENLNISIANLKKLVTSVKAIITDTEKIKVTNELYRLRVTIREKEPSLPIDIPIALLGSVDAGKSTLLGVLQTGKCDNGRGWARQFVTHHKHEMETGQTSSIGFHIMGFDENGDTITSVETRRERSWKDITHGSDKLISFIDLCGHEKYYKSTITGITGMKPEYAIILIESSKVAKRKIKKKGRDGIVRTYEKNIVLEDMTMEHMALCKDNNVPFIILLTKCDMGQKVPDIYKNKIASVRKTIRKGLGKNDVEINSESDILNVIDRFQPADDGLTPIVPYMTISATTGENLDLLKKLLFLLPKRLNHSINKDKPINGSIAEYFKVEGVGTVIHVVLLSGTVSVGDKIKIGPDGNGKYKDTTIRTIQYKRNNVKTISSGRYITICLTKIKLDWIRKGMVIISKEVQPVTVFDAEVRIKQNPSAIRANYECPIHINNIRQTCKILEVFTEDGQIRSKQTGRIRFECLARSICVTVGAKLIFRENVTRGSGHVVNIVK